MYKAAIVLALAVLSGTGTADALELKQVRPAAVAAGEQARVAAVVRDLGFTVGAITPAGAGQWDVQVEGYDPGKAAAAFRGAVKGPAMRFAGPGQAMGIKDGMRGGRPLGGGTRASGGNDGDGSQSGAGGGTDEPADPFGIGGSGEDGGAGGGIEGGDGSATGGGNDGGPDSSGSPRSGMLRVSVEAGGALRVDAQSLRKLGLQPGAQRAGVSIR